MKKLMKLTDEEQQLILTIRAGGSFTVSVVFQDEVYAVVTSDKHHGGGTMNVGTSPESFEAAWNGRVLIPFQWPHEGLMQDL